MLRCGSRSCRRRGMASRGVLPPIRFSTCAKIVSSTLRNELSTRQAGSFPGATATARARARSPASGGRAPLDPTLTDRNEITLHTCTSQPRYTQETLSVMDGTPRVTADMFSHSGVAHGEGRTGGGWRVAARERRACAMELVDGVHRGPVQRGRPRPRGQGPPREAGRLPPSCYFFFGHKILTVRLTSRPPR